MDARLVQARELHRRVAESERLAGQHREQRNAIIRELAGEGLTHRAIAAAVGCSPHLVTSIVMGRVGPGTRSRTPRSRTD